MTDREIALLALKDLLKHRIEQQTEKYVGHTNNDIINTNNDIVNNQVLIMHTLKGVIMMLEELRLHQQFPDLKGVYGY